MARVRGRDNVTTELVVAKLLRTNRITGWRRHFSVFGKPDFAFPKARVAIFVDGCFWHGCPKCYRAPESSVTFWRDKVRKNMERDLKVSRQLRSRGWRVVRARECQLKAPTRFINRIKSLIMKTCRPRPKNPF